MDSELGMRVADGCQRIKAKRIKLIALTESFLLNGETNLFRTLKVLGISLMLAQSYWNCESISEVGISFSYPQRIVRSENQKFTIGIFKLHDRLVSGSAF